MNQVNNSVNLATNAYNPLHKSKTQGDFTSVYRNTLGTVQNSNVQGTFNSQDYLEERYPGIKYNVADLSEFKYGEPNTWRVDFPASELYKQPINVDKIISWRPTTAYATGHEDYVQKDLKSIPDLSYSVIIHPDVQARMDVDANYAKEITHKVDRHFQDTLAINKSIDPDSIKTMSQVIEIDKDGELGFRQSSGDSSNSFEPPINKEKRDIINRVYHQPDEIDSLNILMKNNKSLYESHEFYQLGITDPNKRK